MTLNGAVKNARCQPFLFFVIEHLEPEVGKWLYFEYMNASRIVGKDRLIFTNVKNMKDAETLSGLGTVRHESFIEIFSPEKIVILDPRAPERLKPEDFAGKEAVIIGGILGDHPPRGRTRKLVTDKAPSSLSRNIGRGQFSIDGAVYV
ncbi:MAG: RNA methyltransferase, partial [Candidatus Bathyarchaeia archaeon]